VASFFTSRTATNDGAFYRQFGLADMAKKVGNGKPLINFEKIIAEGILYSEDFPEEVKNKMPEIISQCIANIKPSPNYADGKVGGTEIVYKTLYTMWAEALNAQTYPDLMGSLTELIKYEVLERLNTMVLQHQKCFI